MKYLVICLLILCGCQFTGEQLDAMQKRVDEGRATVRQGGEYAQASVIFARVVKETLPEAVKAAPALAPYAEKVLSMADKIEEKGQVVVEAAGKADLALSAISTTLSEIKSTIPMPGPDGKPASVPWYSVVLGVGLAVVRTFLKVA